MKTLVVFGTRPEAIKCFPVIRALQDAPGHEVVTCSTAQHRTILDQVLAVAGLKPDIDLDLMRQNPKLSDITCDVLQSLQRVIEDVKPDRVLVQGDTTTAMSAALAAFYNKVPVGHIEAGLRTDTIMSPWPEEANRRLVSVLADMHFAPTDVARQNLVRENVPDENIYVTGNTVIDALQFMKARLDDGAVDQTQLPPEVVRVLNSGRKLILLTAHRRENWGHGIAEICKVVRHLADRGDVDILYPVHPNPNVRTTVHEALESHQNVSLVDPLDYTSFISVLNACYLTLTDSGGIQEEAPALGKPVLVLRDTTERPEGVAAGAARLVGLDFNTIVANAEELLDNASSYKAMSEIHLPFGDGRASGRIVDALNARAGLPA